MFCGGGRRCPVCRECSAGDVLRRRDVGGCFAEEVGGVRSAFNISGQEVGGVFSQIVGGVLSGVV